MRRVLICTVGGSHEPIIRAIESVRPDHVCFVCSDDDPATGSKGSYVQIIGKGAVIKASFRDEKPTLPNIPEQMDLTADSFSILKVIPDDLDDVYAKVIGWLATRDTKSEQVIADYTGGTKSMSAGLVAAALDADGVSLQLVSGSRANLVKVESGSEMVIPASIERTRSLRQLEQALQPWSRFAYEESAMLLDQMSPPQDRTLLGRYQRARGLSQAFSAWDRFDHRAAYGVIKNFRAPLGKAGYGDMLNTLELLVGDSPAREPLRILDLWRNAERRAEQGRYDDAVSRLYRMLEWSAQWILRERADIATADVPEEKIPEGITLTQNREGKWQAGLFNAWALAADYGGDVVAAFWQQNEQRMLDLLQSRNTSILAHGFKPLGEEGWRRFFDWTETELLPMFLKLTEEQPYRIRKPPRQLMQKLNFGDDG